MGVTSRLQLPLPLSTSPRYPTLPGATRAGYSAPDFRHGQHHQTSPRGAVTSGNAAVVAVPRGGSVRRRLLSARIYGKSRITHRRKLWRATMMLGAESMGRAARRNICSVEKTITTLACRFPFARPNSVAVGMSAEIPVATRRAGVLGCVVMRSVLLVRMAVLQRASMSTLHCAFAGVCD